MRGGAWYLVFGGDRPCTNDLAALAEQTVPLLADAMPRGEGEDKRLFDLLRRAYIETLPAIFEARSIPVSPATRATIEGCRDHAVLKRWITRAMTTDTAEHAIAP